MGLSDKPDDGGGVRPPADPDGARYDYTLRSRIDDLGALLRHAGIDDATPVTLAVHDWGGMIGFGWALSHMPQVQRLVVLNTAAFRSEEHTSELQSLMRISYAVFCLKKQKKTELDRSHT